MWPRFRNYDIVLTRYAFQEILYEKSKKKNKKTKRIEQNILRLILAKVLEYCQQNQPYKKCC